MIVLFIFLFGLFLGSFVNALEWRVYEQEKASKKKTPDKNYLNSLSITRGRSMCPHCKHTLATKDLVPILSWLSTQGKCRYCGKKISLQYPLVEFATAIVFIASYAWWPDDIQGVVWLQFIIWLLIATGLMALLVYDLKRQLLPNRIMYPLGVIAGGYVLVSVLVSDNVARSLLNVVLAVGVGGGIFYVIFQVSRGKWIGGGDVKLGWLLGLVLGTPGKSFLMIFVASVLGCLISVPLLATKRVSKDTAIPFGPFLIAGAFIALLFGTDILDWYKQAILLE